MLLLVLAVFSKVIDLTAETFDQHVGGDSPALIKFYAPWYFYVNLGVDIAKLWPQTMPNLVMLTKVV